MGRNQRKSEKKNKQNGGVGASDYAIQVYGSAGQQTAVTGSNVIHAKYVGAGKRKSLKLTKRGGRCNLRKRRSAKKSRGGDGEAVAPIPESAPSSAESTVAKSVTETAPAVESPVAESVTETAPTVESPVAESMPESASVVESPVAETVPATASASTTGGFMASSLAVPAILLTANHLYGKRKNTVKFTKSHSRIHSHNSFRRRKSNRTRRT